LAIRVIAQFIIINSVSALFTIVVPLQINSVELNDYFIEIIGVHICFSL
jgi:hypothetical protein